MTKSDIEARISIISTSIKLYESVVFDGSAVYSKQLADEKKNLQKMKKKYPEYFV